MTPRPVRAAAPARAAAGRSGLSRAGSASPRSRRWCAIPTRSSPATSCGSSRSIRSACCPRAADRGTILHDVARRLRRAPSGRSAGTTRAADLLQRGADRFRDIADAYPELHALWWPAFQRFVPAYLEWERERRGGLRRSMSSARARSPSRSGEGDVFTCAAGPTGSRSGRTAAATIVDFKSGRVPTRQGRGGRLLAAADAGGRDADGEAAFAGRARPPGRCRALDYVKIGGREPIRSCAGPAAAEGRAQPWRRSSTRTSGRAEELVRRYAVEGGRLSVAALCPICAHATRPTTTSPA